MIISHSVDIYQNIEPLIISKTFPYPTMQVHVQLDNDDSPIAL